MSSGAIVPDSVADHLIPAGTVILNIFFRIIVWRETFVTARKHHYVQVYAIAEVTRTTRRSSIYP